MDTTEYLETNDDDDKNIKVFLGNENEKFNIPMTKEERTKNSLLLEASKNGDLEVVKKLVSEGVDVTYTNEHGWNGLLWASSNGHVEVLRYLLSEHAGDLYIESQKSEKPMSKKKNLQENNPVHWACFKGHVMILWKLIEEGFSIDLPDKYGNRSIHLACSGGHFSILEALLTKGMDLTTKNIYGNTPLSLATEKSCRSLLLNVLSQKSCAMCHHDFGLERKPGLCQKCHKMICKDSCTTSIQKLYSLNSHITYPVQYCKTCYEGVEKAENNLRNILASVSEKILRKENKTFTSNFSGLDAAEIENNIEKDEDIEKNVSKASIVDDKERKDSVQSKHDEPQHLQEIDENKIDEIPQYSFSVVLNDVEPLHTATIEAKNMGLDIKLIQQANEAYQKYISHINLILAINELNSKRPIKIMSLLLPIRQALSQAQNDCVDLKLINYAQNIIRCVESEINLLGVYSLCDKITIGNIKNTKEFKKLADAIFKAEGRKASQKLIDQAQALLNRLSCESEFQLSLTEPEMIEVHKENSSKVYKLANGDIEDSLLKCLEKRISCLLEASEKADKIEGVNQELVESAQIVLKQLRKELKEEQKCEEERKRLEEETAAKAAVKRKKKTAKK